MFQVRLSTINRSKRYLFANFTPTYNKFYRTFDATRIFSICEIGNHPAICILWEMMGGYFILVFNVNFSLFRRSSPTCPADRQRLSREKVFHSLCLSHAVTQWRIITLYCNFLPQKDPEYFGKQAALRVQCREIWLKMKWVDSLGFTGGLTKL